MKSDAFMNRHSTKRRDVAPLPLEIAMLLLSASVTGCSPMQQIGGSYFPAWLLCMISGFLGTIAIRVLLVRLRIDPWIRPRELAYPCLGAGLALLLHLIFFSS